MTYLTDQLHRAWRRRHIVAGTIAVTIPYLVFGNLNIGWSLAGVAAASAWAAFWPDSGSAGGLRAAEALKGALGREAERDARVIPLSLLDGLPDAALLLDQRGVIIEGNAVARSISPVLAGRPLFHWNRSPELLAAVDQANETATQQRCHVRVFTPVERSFDVLITPASDPATGMPPVLLLALRDLTEQEQVARMRVDFVANASHELRTPLASLRGFIETLQGAAKNDPAAQTRFLGIMQAQAERMSRLIEDLLSLNRIEMREHVAPTGSVDLAAVVRDAASALKPIAASAGITIEEAAIRGPANVTGDRDELMQVAQNLMQNALKYGRPEGHVAVSVKREGSQFVLAVADDGIGIAAEHIPRLTERFYRVSAKESKERGGTGLGLAIVKHIVKRHRGELKITSTPGRGSTFTITLPAADGPN